MNYRITPFPPTNVQLGYVRWPKSHPEENSRLGYRQQLEQRTAFTPIQHMVGMYIATSYSCLSQVQHQAMLQEPFPGYTCSSWAILLGHTDHKDLGLRRMEERNTGSKKINKKLPSSDVTHCVSEHSVSPVDCSAPLASLVWVIGFLNCTRIIVMLSHPSPPMVDGARHLSSTLSHTAERLSSCIL